MATIITDNDFDSVVLQSSTPVLVDFWAPWCGPCRIMGPIIDELGKEYDGKVSVVKMNVDENPTIPGKYNIRSIPTFILFKGGEAVDQLAGAVSKANLAAILDKNL